MKITHFVDEYDFLANTFNHPFVFDGLKFSTAEAAFYAQRVRDVKARRKYTRLNPNQARSKALQAIPIDEWDSRKLSIMEKVLRAKFSDPELKKKLLDTGDASLINTNSYRDDYWGIYMGKGKNKLGVLLEKIRDELKEA